MEIKKVHFIGIGGIGLSALARFLKYRGFEVSGSDIKQTPITKQLEIENIKITIPHNKDAISNQDLVIYSAAITPDNIELITASKKGLKLLSRKEALPWILKDTKNFAICAAHGKSTTSAILASILNSSALIGAISKEFNSNFRYVNDILVFEADESDESFILSNPYCSIVINTEPEHMEYYNYDYKRFYNAYKKFLDIAKVRVINENDEFLKKYSNKAIKLNPTKDIQNITFFLKDNEPYTKFSLKDWGEFEVWGIGEHIALNASLAILAASKMMKIPQIKQNILKYKGIKKRFDIIYKSDSFFIIDDYAHHPTEIIATINSLQIYKDMVKIDKIIAIWQPHKYSRTKDNLDYFKKAFDGVDELIILPVWTVAEKIIFIDFAKEFSHYNPIFATKIVRKDNYLEVVFEDKVIKKIDSGIAIGLGAGDITYQLR